MMMTIEATIEQYDAEIADMVMQINAIKQAQDNLKTKQLQKAEAQVMTATIMAAARATALTEIEELVKSTGLTLKEVTAAVKHIVV